MIELRLLGVLDLRREGAESLTAILSQPKRFALLAYLALAPEQSFRRRDSIAALLWPEQDQEHARGSLRQAVRFLRRELGDDAIRNRGEEEIGLDAALVWCDVAALERALQVGAPVEAARLYRGDLLEGFFVADAAAEFDQWLDAERARLRTLAGIALWDESERFKLAGSLAEAIAAARRAVRLAPDEETGLRRLLVLLDETGDRAGAMAAYETFEAHLKKEFGGAPSVESQQLIRAIRARALVPSQPVPESVRSPATQVAASSGGGPAAAPSRRSGIPAAITVVLLLVIGYFVVSSRGGGATRSGALTIAVLPVQDLTGDTTQAVLAEAITDELITDLAQISALRVINRRTMMLYRDSTAAPEQLGEGLGAHAVVTSSLQRAGDSLVFRAQLVTVGDSRVVWAESFSGDAGHALSWQQQVARAIAEQARVKLTPPEREGLAARRVVDPRALDLYTRGRWWWNKRGVANLAKADQLFHQALDVDPGYAPIWSALADTYAQIGYAGSLPPEEAFKKAKAMAARALELDSTLAEPHAALGFATMYFDWNWAGAEREFRLAIGRNPSYATAHEWYGLFLAAMGRYAEAETEVRLAQELDPLSAAAAGTRGWVIHYAGKDEEALRVLRAAERTDPANGNVQLYLGRVYQAMGQLDSATAHYRATGPLQSWVPTIAGNGVVAALAGQPKEARRVLRRLDSLGRTSYVTPYALALVYTALGERDSAFTRLEQGYRERTHWLVWLHRDSRWQSLRSDPRFADLVRRIGLPQ